MAFKYFVSYQFSVNCSICDAKEFMLPVLKVPQDSKEHGAVKILHYYFPRTPQKSCSQV